MHRRARGFVLAWLPLAVASGCGRIHYDPLARDDGGRDSGTRDAAAVDARLLDAELLDAEPLDAPIVDAAELDGSTPCTTFGAWSVPVSIPELAGGENEFDPAQRGDRLQIWYVAPGLTEIHTRRRATAAEPYGLDRPESVNGSPGSDQDPTPTGDGLVLLWASNRTGTYRVYEARRTTVDDAFGPAAVARGLESEAPPSLDITPDGLTIYFDRGAELARATRPDLDSTFGPPTGLGFRAQFPAISPDELELYYVSGVTTIVRTRRSVVDPFGPETAIPGFCDECGDPDVLPDGLELTVNDLTGNVLRSTRSCTR